MSLCMTSFIRVVSLHIKFYKKNYYIITYIYIIVILYNDKIYDLISLHIIKFTFSCIYFVYLERRDIFIEHNINYRDLFAIVEAKPKIVRVVKLLFFPCQDIGLVVK